MTDTGYQFFEHTADVGLRVHGATLAELLCHAAQGLVRLLVEEGPIGSQETRSIELSAPSAEVLLERWLRELLFWFGTDHFLPSDYRLDVVTDTQLRGRIRGERFDSSKHVPGVEVKGVTYHQFRLTHTPTGWDAELIFDI